MSRQARKRHDRSQPAQPGAADEVVEKFFHAIAAAEGEVGAIETELRRFLEERPTPFSYIVRRLGRLNQEGQQLFVLAVKGIGNPEAVRELSRCLADPEISLRARVEIVRLLRDAGLATDRELASAVDQAHAVVEKAKVAEGQETSLAPVLAELAALPKSTARMALRELARTDLHRAVALFRALVRRQPEDLDYALLTVEALDGVVHQEAANYLAALLEERQARALQRPIRRALYRLRLSGLRTEVPASGKERTSVVKRPEFRFISAHASHFDGAGNRSFYLAKAKPLGGVHLIFASINDRKGILDFAVAALRKREYEGMRRKLAEEGLFVDIEPSYAVAQVMAAGARNRESGTALPTEYVTSQTLLGEAQPHGERAEALAYSRFDEEELANLPARLDDAARLFEREEFRDWKIPADDLASYLYDYEEVEESRIVVSNVLKQERLGEVYRKAAAGLMAGELRSIYKARLEEMTYVLCQKGEKRWGSVALAAAAALRSDSSVPAEKNPFVLELVRRSLAAARRETRDRLIARPRAQEPSAG